MKKYTYNYEKISCHYQGFGLLNGNIYSINDYKVLIEKKAKQGWRYVGFIPTKQRGTGHIEELELIFEKELESEN